MARKIPLAAVAASILAIWGAGAQAQPSGYGAWQTHYNLNGVRVEYAQRASNDEVRVVWRCTNNTSQTISCSVGAGRDKEYQCWRANTTLGSTRMPGERATVRANGNYTFPSDWACRGTGATSVSPVVRISIER
jgi:hypothetical protein